MAITTSASGVRLNAFRGVGLLCLLLAPLAAATQFMVGGPMGWTVPLNPNAMSYNQWAELMRFQIGDSMLFMYPPDKDSVLQVTKEDYTTCNTASPIARFDDGNTVFMFNQSGPYYFISGVQENCLKNESMVVIVLADRSGRSSGLSSSSPPPPPGSADTVPQSPPSGSSEFSPPTFTTSGASLMVLSFMVYFGALLGPFLLIFV